MWEIEIVVLTKIFDVKWINDSSVEEARSALSSRRNGESVSTHVAEFRIVNRGIHVIIR